MIDGHLSLEEKERLCEVLLEVRSLHDPQTRDLYVTELQRVLSQALVVQRYADARHDLWAVLTACDSHQDGLKSFIRVVRSFHGSSRAVVEFERVLGEAELRAATGDRPGPTEPRLLARHQRETLSELIKVVAPERAAGVFQEVFRQAGLSDDAAKEPSAVVQRVETAALNGDLLPQLLAYVDRLAHQAGDEHGLEMHRWIDAVGAGFGFSSRQIRVLCSNTTHLLEHPIDSALSPPHGVSFAEGWPATDILSRSSDVSGDILLTPAVVAPPILKEENVRLIWGGVPIRNPDFTGREEHLRRLREALATSSKVSVLPQALHGLGGVGKTQLAVEYVYRYASEYDLVWWVSAEQASLVRVSLASLGDRLRLPPSQDMQQTATTVLDALGASPLRWLIVYDNADEPDEITPLLPTAAGHVIVTSRNQSWETVSVGSAIEVDVFDRAESINLLRKRGGMSEADADRLAEKLGDLPLALDQAATWRAATGMPVQQYLELFEEHAAELMSEGKPVSYPTTVYAFLRVAVDRLRSHAPGAAELFELFTFLGAEPLSSNVLRAGRSIGITDALASTLREPIAMSRAIRELRKLGLAKVDPGAAFISVHRLVQLVLREDLTAERKERARHNVHQLLASANPHKPLEPANWSLYAQLGPHIEAAELINSGNLEARRVVLDQARYLHRIGDYESSRQLSEAAVEAWSVPVAQGGLGEGHEFTLVAQRLFAGALRSLGENERARQIEEATFERLRNDEMYGENHEHTLQTANSVAHGLRVSGEFDRARQLDEENLARHIVVFGEGDEFTLSMKNNVAVNRRMLGDYRGALEIDQQVASQWEQTVGKNDSRALFSISNLARDLYSLGRYTEALELQRQAYPVVRDQLGERHNEVLLAARTIAIALRKTGQYPEATKQARDNYLKYHGRFGADHEHTLAATMSFANCLRAMGEVAEAYGLATDAVQRYGQVFGARHALTLAAQVNLCIILRSIGAHSRAHALGESTLETMTDVVGPRHPYTLCAASSLASDLALQQKVTDALMLSQQTLAASLEVRGDSHPYTFACAINASFDLQAAGEKEGRALYDRTIVALRAKLGDDHPEVLDANRGIRMECDIEPPPT